LLSRAAVPALGVGVATTGCSSSPDPLQVMVVWSGTELEVFRKALATFEETYDAEVDLISAGDGIGALLRSRIEAGHPPDVAVLPNPGLLAELLKEYEQNFASVLDEIAPGDDPMWKRRLLEHDGSLFGVWVKVTHKSVFWCRKELTAVSTPDTLPELVNRLTRLARTGHRPLSIGAADGWVLTDWFENALLAVDSETYRCLAGKTEDPAMAANLWDSSSVREALLWLGRIWGIPEVFANGPERALLTQYDEAALRTFVDHRDDGAVTLGGDYTALLLRPYQDENLAPVHLDSFGFPARTSKEKEQQPLLVGGDAAVLLRRSDREPRDKACDLIRWLAGKDASNALATGGFLTIHAALVKRKARPSQMSRAQWELTGQLIDGSPEFDLSDQLQGGLTRSDGQGLAGILQDFFAEVAERGDGSADGGDRVRSAVAHAQDRIVDVAGGS
jgi:alpha-glucoside transport system substrate-binding protein